MIKRGLSVAAIVVILDRFTKYLMLQHFGVAGCGLDHREQITSFMDLVLTCNRGMSFGMFNSGAGLSVPLFSLAAAIIVAVLIVWLARVRSEVLATGIGLIIGGAIGNVIDRWWFGGVIDFLSFHLGSWFSWPAFNIADSAICLGVLAMLFEGLLPRRLGPQAEGSEELRR
jgi:signal peptidase II